jgi:hypothetical protein
VAALLCVGATASDDLEQIAATFAANRERLRGYGWRSGTELTVDGETMSLGPYEVRYDSRGELVRTPVPVERGPDGRNRRPSGRKRQQYEKLLVSLRALIDSYVEPDPRTARQLYSDATVWEGDARSEGMSRIQARDVLRKGDSVSLWLDAVTRTPQRLEILTSSGGEPVRVSAEFASLPEGAFYPSRVVVETEIKEKKLVFTTRSSDVHPPED